MVSPAPHLERKIRNTRGIVTANKSSMVPSLNIKYPDDYLDLDAFTKFENIKPWKPRTVNAANQKIPGDLSTLQLSNDKLLVLCVDFSDRPAQIPISEINTRYFATGTSDKSLTTYYIENSYGTFTLNGEVHGWYRAPQPLSYYAANNSGFGTYPQNTLGLINDVLNIASSDPNINFNAIDANNDGILSYISIVHAGAEAAWTGLTSDLWAVTYSWSGNVRFGTTNKYFNKLMISAEYMGSASDQQRIGVDAHEFSHVLGVGDLYAYNGTSNGVGKWSLMSAGNWNDNGITPGHLDPYSKISIGFGVPKNDAFGQLILQPNEINNNFYLFTSTDPKQYFIIENRLRTGYDISLPWFGLLVWHVNENQPDNNDPACLRVAVIQADNKKDLENKINSGDSGDPYPGVTNNTSFGKLSIPVSSLCDGQVLDMILNNITYQDPNRGYIINLDSTLPCNKNPVLSQMLIQ